MIKFIHIGIRNVTRYKNLFIQIIIAFSIIEFVFLMGLTYHSDVNRALLDLENNSASGNCIILYNQPLDSSLYEEITSIKGVRDVNIIAASNSLSELVAMPLFEQFRFEDTALEIDGIKYNGLYLQNSMLNSLTLSNETINTYFMIEFMPSGQFIPQSEIKEYKTQSGKSTPFVAGRAIYNDNEVMLSEYVLARYGVEVSKDLIGKDVVFYVPTSHGLQPFSQKFSLSGVIDAGFWNIESRVLQSQIIVTSTNTNIASGYNYKIYPDTFDSASSIITEIQNLTGENPTYHFMGQDAYSALELQRNLINSVLFIISIVIFVSIITYAANIYTHYIGERKYAFGVLKSAGITTNDLMIIVFSELSFSIVLSFLIVVPLVIIASSIFYSFLHNLLSVSFKIQVVEFLKYFILTLVLSIILIIIFTKKAIKNIKNCNIVNLLK